MYLQLLTVKINAFLPKFFSFEEKFWFRFPILILLASSIVAFASKWVYFLRKVLTEVREVRVNSTCWCVGLHNFKWEQWVCFQDPFYVRFVIAQQCIPTTCTHYSVFQLHTLPRCHNIAAQGEHNWIYPHKSQSARRSNLHKISVSLWQGQGNYVGATAYQSRR